MELKARSIKLFCAVVETGSLLSAANQNAMSAPAASRAVSQLEDRLGCRLFDRSTKNLTLTEDGKAVVSVADTGIGIAPEHRERIFERFYRVDKSHSKASGGTGLGLSIVKHAVQYHHGTVELHSEEGKGTTICILLPKE